MGRACNTNGDMRNSCRLLVGKPEQKKLLGRPRCRRVDNIKMDLGELGWGRINWIGLAQDWDKWRALVNAVTNFEFHKMLGSSGVTLQLAASRLVLNSIESVS
jgi:hypothetical protein